MDALTPQLVEFIASQPLFFVATAAESGRVNVSPNGFGSGRSPAQLIRTPLRRPGVRR